MPLAALALSAACAEPSPPGGVVVAPTATAGVNPSSDASSDAAGGPGVAGPAPPGDGAPARFRACAIDADCVAVPRVGCCHNGWNEAVAASQKDAYLASFVCPDPHPICAMFIVRDTRVPRCDAGTRLCTLVNPP
jgi:hypothetical protein